MKHFWKVIVIVFALLLLRDFIQTERQAKRDAEENEHE